MLHQLPRELARLIEGTAPDAGAGAATAPGKGTGVAPSTAAGVPPSAVERVKAYAGESVRDEHGAHAVTAEGGFASSPTAEPITRTSDPEAYGQLAAILFQRPPARANAGAAGVPTVAAVGMTTMTGSTAIAPQPPPSPRPQQPSPPSAEPIAMDTGEHETVRAVNAAWAMRDAAAAGPAPAGPRDPSVDARPSATRAVSQAIARDRPAAMGAGELLALEHRLIATFEAKAYATAHAQLDANERIARAEAGRYGEVSSGDPTTAANQLRTAATALGAVQTQIIERFREINGRQAAYGAPQAHISADNLDDYLDAGALMADPTYRALRLSYDTLRRIYGPVFPVLLHKNTDYNALANADPARLAELVAGATGDVLTKIRKTRAKLTPEKTWSLAPVVEMTKRAMGLDTSCAALFVIERHKADRDRDAAFVALALGALGLGIAIAGIAVTFASGGAGAPVGAAALATAEGMGSLALIGAGVGVTTALQQYAEYDFKHAAAGSSLDPVTALSAEDPSLGWLVVAIAGACLDVGATIVAFRNLSAIARAVQTAEELTALEQAAMAQAAALAQQGKLAGTEQEFVQRVMRSADAKLASKARKKPPVAGALEEELASSEKAYAEASKGPVAILPSGREIKPSNYGGGFHCPSEQVPPDIAFVEGLPARGSDTRLLEHAIPGSELPSGKGSAFRGTTPQATAPNDAAAAGQGAAYWGEPGQWVYEISGVPTWNLEQALQGQIRRPDGSFGALLTVSEVEGAIPARVLPTNIVRGGKIELLPSGRMQVTEWIANPNYKPRSP